MALAWGDWHDQPDELASTLALVFAMSIGPVYMNGAMYYICSTWICMIMGLHICTFIYPLPIVSCRYRHC